MKIIAISGSLRARSSNRAMLQAAAKLAPEGTEVRHLRRPRLSPKLQSGR
ncbi:MAG TPA: NAD(P)H-dependent oxidoreductase [Thermoanaerobaculia bacterium]